MGSTLSLIMQSHNDLFPGPGSLFAHWQYTPSHYQNLTCFIHILFNSKKMFKWMLYWYCLDKCPLVLIMMLLGKAKLVLVFLWVFPLLQWYANEYVVSVNCMYSLYSFCCHSHYFRHIISKCTIKIVKCRTW